jgi:hypothetical protein
MSWMGSHDVSLGAGSAPAGLRRSTARWAAGGAAAAATVAAGMMAAPSALAVATIPVPCSVAALKAAITFAPSNAILVLKSGCVYRLTAALPTITRNLTIAGSNDTITAFSGLYTILTNNGADVSISQARFTDAKSTKGPGAIENENNGVLSLTSDTFLHNEGTIGGAIRNELGATLTAASCTFVDNESTGADVGVMPAKPTGPGGGAIANGPIGTTTVSGSTFLDNDAEDGGGGAIGSFGGTVTVRSPASTFTGNSADDDGGAIDAILGTLSVTKATFNDNESGDDGGAVANFGAAGTLAQSGFTRNHADDDGGAVADSTLLNLDSDTLSANHSDHNGGGLFVHNGGNVTLNTTDVFGNFAGTKGGGIRLVSGVVSFVNTNVVILNQPTNCSGLTCPA